MRRRSRELWYASGAILVITVIYAVVAVRLDSVPAARGLYGHGLGVAGFLLMLMTETLYSLRKRSQSARWGRPANWLRFHIFTGLVGPYMVLLHTSWKFNGLAGAVAAMTAVVVVSGFVGRYIYTAVPRTAEGAEIEAAELESQILAAEAELEHWLAKRPESASTLIRHLDAISGLPQDSPLLVLGRALQDVRDRLQWRRDMRQIEVLTRTQVRELERLLRRRRLLRRQLASLALTRRLLANWHAIHIPIGMVLFTAAFIHIGAAIYYATLLK
jgi:hypothetical protein